MATESDPIEQLIESWIIINTKDLQYVKEAKLQARKDFLTAIRQEVEKAYQRGYNTGFQKHGRIDRRETGVAHQLRIIADTLEGDAAALRGLEGK